MLYIYLYMQREMLQSEVLKYLHLLDTCNRAYGSISIYLSIYIFFVYSKCMSACRLLGGAQGHSQLQNTKSLGWLNSGLEFGARPDEAETVVAYLYMLWACFSLSIFFNLPSCCYNCNQLFCSSSRGVHQMFPYFVWFFGSKLALTTRSPLLHSHM
jgi:hypothetical protein